MVYDISKEDENLFTVLNFKKGQTLVSKLDENRKQAIKLIRCYLEKAITISLGTKNAATKLFVSKRSSFILCASFADFACLETSVFFAFNQSSLQCGLVLLLLGS